MSNYKAENSQIGAFGEHAVSYGNKFEQKNVIGIDNEVNIEAICDELEIILGKINEKKDKNSEDYRFIANTMEIYETAKKNNKKDTLDKLQKYATNFFYTMATGVGGGIIANIISKALGI